MEKSNDKKFKIDMNKRLSYLILVLFLIITIALGFTIFAWAKYNSLNKGQALADVAKWYFKVTGNSEQSADNISFAITRTDNNRYS